MVEVLGKKTVVTAGTPVPVTTEANPKSVQSIVFQVLPGNTGLIYIRRKGPGTPTDDRTNLVYTIAILPAPTSATAGPFSSFTVSVPVIPASIGLGDFYLDASANNQSVLVTVTRG